MTTSGPETPVTVQGVIERFTFRNPDTDWAVVKLVDEASGQPLTVVGSVVLRSVVRFVSEASASSSVVTS